MSSPIRATAGKQKSNYPEITRLKLSVTVKLGSMELSFVDNVKYRINLIGKNGPLIRIEERRTGFSTFTSLSNAVFFDLKDDSLSDEPD